MFRFKVIKKGKKNRSRIGVIETSRGKIETPCFVPVATKGAVKGASFEKIKSFGAGIFMVNTFHFFCNQKYKEVSRFKGLHRFLGIDYPLMTDSGGFQVFSLGSGWEQGTGKIIIKNKKKDTSNKRNNVEITDKGVIFKSPYNGDRMEMTPEISIKVQEKLQADIIFAFDECTSPFDSYHYHRESLQRTNKWALRSLKSFKSKNQAIFGIIQGGKYQDLRKESAQFIGSLPFSGFGIGGSFGESYGDSKKTVSQVIEWIIPALPEKKPRHLLGIGEPDDILEAIERGIDSFDCVIPTRWARHGTAITSQGRINLKSSRFLKSKNPIDKKCSCLVCSKYSSSYVSHLLKEKEIYGVMLLTEHNLYWILNFMKEIRESIKNDSFESFKKSFFKTYF